MNLPSPAWLLVLALSLAGAISIPIYLRRQSLRRLQRLKRRDDDLFDDLVDGPEELQENASQQAREQIKLFHRGLKRIVTFTLALLLSVVLAIPYFSTLPAALVSFILGAVTLVLGIAAKPAIENFISGIVLAFSRTINIGDTVMLDNKHYGTIEDLGYTHCVVRIWDWRRYVVPNTEMLSKSFVNYTLHDNFVHAYVEFRVAPDSDMDQVEKLCQEIPKQSQYHADHEEPALWVMDMSKDSILCWCGAWADSPSDAWMLKSDIRNGLIRGFQKQGITTHSMRMVHEPAEAPVLLPEMDSAESETDSKEL